MVKTSFDLKITPKMSDYVAEVIYIEQEHFY